MRLVMCWQHAELSPVKFSGRKQLGKSSGVKNKLGKAFQTSKITHYIILLYSGITLYLYQSLTRDLDEDDSK